MMDYLTDSLCSCESSAAFSALAKRVARLEHNEELTVRGLAYTLSYGLCYIFSWLLCHYLLFPFLGIRRR